MDVHGGLSESAERSRVGLMGNYIVSPLKQHIETSTYHLTEIRHIAEFSCGNICIIEYKMVTLHQISVANHKNLT